MRHSLLTFLSAVFLLLCVAVCGLWVRSYWRRDMLFFYPGDRRVYGIGTSRGVIGAAAEVADTSPRKWQYDAEPADDWQSRYDLTVGFGTYTHNLGNVVFVPHVLVIVASGALAGGFWLYRCRRNRRASAGLCPGCCYDLRATPDRCPECGRAAGGSF
jgi:hypothetical protein